MLIISLEYENWIKTEKRQIRKISLFLEIYKGSYIDDEGKRKHIKEYEYLKKYLYEEHQNAKERKENREALEFAQDDKVVIKYLHEM